MTEECKPLSHQEVAEITAYEAKATKGPWTAEWGYAGAERTLFLARGASFDGVLFGQSYDAAEKAQHEADTTFAAHSRQAIPRLIATIAVKEKRIKALETEVGKLRTNLDTLADCVGKEAPYLQAAARRLESFVQCFGVKPPTAPRGEEQKS